MRIDPYNIELKKILDCYNFKDKTILEIGCGNGRLTKKLAKYAKKIYALEPDRKKLREAINSTTKNLSKKIVYIQGYGERLEFEDSMFDTVCYLWSLHHIPYKKQIKSFKEACRVLKRKRDIFILEPTLEGEEAKIYFYEDKDIINAEKSINKLIKKSSFGYTSRRDFLKPDYFKSKEEAYAHFIGYYTEDGKYNLRNRLSIILEKLFKNSKKGIYLNEGTKIITLKKLNK